MPGRPRLLLAITSHGLGHLTRTLAVARELRGLCPSLELVVATRTPPERIARDLPLPFEHRDVDYEPGTVQRNSFELDPARTLRAYQGYLEERERRIEAEARFLAETGVGGVVSDVPAIAVRAAARVGIPAIGFANFTWDWILEPLLEGTPLAALIPLLREDYAQGLCHLQLPFGPRESPFPNAERAPLVSRHASVSPGAVRRQLGLPDDGKDLVLVCPGGWSPGGWPAIHVPGGAGLRFVTVGDLPVTADAPLLSLPHALPEGLSFPDLVGAADAVLAKPGYGIASECVTHRTPLLSIERPGFRETPVLLEQLRALGPCAELSLADFFAGRWEPALRALLEGPKPWSAREEDAALRVAERIRDLLEMGC